MREMSRLEQKKEWAPTDIRIRRMYPEDIPAVAALEKKSFSEPWTEGGFEDALCQRQNIFLVAELMQKKVIGYLGLYASFDEGDITNVSVEEDFRCQGVGYMLVEGLKGLAMQQGIQRIFLEVRASNEAAKRLYQKVGFAECGRRPDFYRKPVEDAVLMSAELMG